MRINPRCLSHCQVCHTALLAFVVAMAAIFASPAHALIEGGEGNSPIRDPGWPRGARELVNHAGRVAYWVGPPFGGGEWHAECRGDTAAINEVLALFAELDIKNKRVVVKDGVGRSFWLNPNRDPAKADAAKIDWAFSVWEKTSWDRMQKMPRQINPTSPEDAKLGPPSQLDVFTGGSIRWADVKVPKGVKVVDERLEAHGFKLTDGTVLEGKLVDPAMKQPVVGKVQLERIEPRKTGGYDYIAVAEATSDEEGRWVIKQAPAGWHRVVAMADGYVSRLIGYAQFDGQPCWNRYSGELVCPAPVAGHVTDENGKPLADVNVRFDGVMSDVAGRYESPRETTVKTDAHGRFQTNHLPAGKADVWIHKPGYCRPGLGLAITMPTKDIALSMMKSAQVRITIDFSKSTRPAEYIVSITPEGGNKIGSWGGSGKTDAKDQIAFSDVPPGKYIVQGSPNPSSANEKTEPKTVELKGGEESEITLRAK